MTPPVQRVLAFAEDGYYVIRKDGSGHHSGLPRKLQEKLERSVKVYSVTIGRNESFFCAWQDKEGKPHYNWAGNDSYPSLSNYISENRTERKFKKYETCYASLGPGPSERYYFHNHGSGQSLRLPAGAAKEVKSRRNGDGSWADDPAIVALGLDDSFVIVGKKGDVIWDLKGHYGTLDSRLKEATSAIEWVTLSPFGGYFYVSFKSGRQSWHTKDEWGLSKYLRGTD